MISSTLFNATYCGYVLYSIIRPLALHAAVLFDSSKYHSALMGRLALKGAVLTDTQWENRFQQYKLATHKN